MRASGIAGDVLTLDWKNDKHFIIKPVKVSYKDSLNTDNNYNLVMPPPRNWKMIGCEHNNPMISGVNPMREIKIFDLLKSKEWYPVVKIEEKEKLNQVMSVNECNDIQRMLKERNLGKLFWIIQNDGGKTLKEYVKDLDLSKRIELYKRVKTIIDEMRMMDILHMDLHPENILVDKDEKISIIDFGWCLHKSFDLNKNEREYYTQCLKNNFDMIHFMESLVVMGVEKNIISQTM